MAKKKEDDDDFEQKQLPGTEDEEDKPLIAAARRFHTNLTKLKSASSDLQASEDAVKELMHKRNLLNYQYKKLKISLGIREKIKVAIEEDE